MNCLGTGVPSKYKLHGNYTKNDKKKQPKNKKQIFRKPKKSFKIYVLIII